MARELTQAQKTARAFYRTAMDLVAQENYTIARKHLEYAMGMDPRFAEPVATYLDMIATMDLGEDDISREVAKTSVTRFPGDARVLGATLLYLQKHDTTKFETLRTQAPLGMGWNGERVEPLSVDDLFSY